MMNDNDMTSVHVLLRGEQLISDAMTAVMELSQYMATYIKMDDNSGTKLDDMHTNFTLICNDIEDVVQRVLHSPIDEDVDEEDVDGVQLLEEQLQVARESISIRTKKLKRAIDGVRLLQADLCTINAEEASTAITLQK